MCATPDVFPSVDSKLVPLTRVAQRLSIKPSQLVAMSRRGEFPAIYTIGNMRRVDATAVAAWLDSRRESEIAKREEQAAHFARFGPLSPEVPA